MWSFRVLIGAKGNCIFKNRSMSLPRAMQKQDLFTVFTWRLLYCKLTKQHSPDIVDWKLFEVELFQDAFQIIFYLQFCVSFGYLNLVCATETFCFTFSPYIISPYCIFFFLKTWPLVCCFYISLFYALDVIYWGFIENIVKNRIFNAHFL